MSQNERNAGGARPPGPVIAVDLVLLAAVVASAYLLPGGSLPLAIVAGAEYLALWWFMWRIAASSPGSLLLTQVFGWRRRPARGAAATAAMTEAVRDRGFANAATAAGPPGFPADSRIAPGSPPAAPAPPAQQQPAAVPPSPVRGQAVPHAAQDSPYAQRQPASAQAPIAAQQSAAAQQPVVLPSPVRGDETRRPEPVPFPAAAAPPAIPRELLLPGGEVVPIAQTPLLIGRRPAPEHGEQPVQLEDEARSISRNHLAVGLIGGRPSAVDRGSANGTRVRRRGQLLPLDPAAPLPLESGDVLVLGRFELAVR